MFSDEEFVQACKELDVPDVNGWELFTESHDVTIYRLYNEESGLYSYKIYGTLKDVSPDVCGEVYMDIDYRRQWDSYVKELLEVAEGEKTGIYWQINFPFPLSNRDYLYRRELRKVEVEGRQVSVILANSDTFDSLPAKSGVVRVADYKQSMAITSDGEHGTKAFMYYYDNPGGMIPTWLINWAAKSGVPGFLTQMQDACRGYQKYLNSRSSNS